MIIYILAFGAALFVLERLNPASPFVASPKWYLRSILLNIVSFSVIFGGTYVLQNLFPAPEVSQSAKSFLSELPAPIKGLIAFIVYNFFFYWWHRIRHENQFLWRTFHQIHHSIQRIEVLSTYYFHPIDILSGLLLGSLVIFVTFGVDLEASAWLSLYANCMGYFIHSNIVAPRWVGYIIQTPQMHRRHHEYNKHDSNYSDIALFDMIFGTYVNPKEPCEACGFDQEKELQLKEMLLFKDMHKR